MTRSQPLYISFAGDDTKFKTKPVVLEGLTMAVNICGPFMKRHSIDQLHSKGALQIQGRLVPLTENPSPRQHEQVTDRVYVKTNTIVPPTSVAYIEVRTPAIAEGRMAPGEVLVTGGVEFMEKTDLHPWLNALAETRPDGTIRVGVMNTQPYQIQVKKGMHFGTVTATCNTKDKDTQPWKIATICPDPKLVKTNQDKPTAKEMGEIIAEFHLDSSPALRGTEEIMRAANLLWKNK